jgi:hypothetical protein
MRQAPASVWSLRTEVRGYRGQRWGVEGVPGGHQDEPSIRGGLHELGHHLSGRIPHEVSFPRRNVRIGKDHVAATMRAMRPAAPCSHLHAATLFACTHACAAICVQPCSHVHASTRGRGEGGRGLARKGASTSGKKRGLTRRQAAPVSSRAQRARSCKCGGEMREARGMRVEESNAG